MIPLHDDNPTRTTPYVTISLIVGCLLFFLFQISVGLNASAYRFGLIPAELLRGVDVIYTGRGVGVPPGTGVTNLEPAWLTVFTSMFSHGGWMHIIGNMWFLWIFGNNVEEAMGRWRYLGFYLFAGVMAAAAQIGLSQLGSQSIPMIGASGAVAGVLGAYLVLFPHSRVLTLVPIGLLITTELPAVVVLGFWFVLELVRGLTSLGFERAGGVAYAAHVGGFITGLILARLLVLPAHRGDPPRRRRRPAVMDEWSDEPRRDTWR